MAAQHKVSARTTTLDAARSLEGALENLIDPAPDAVTRFEDGPDAWRIEAYFSEAPDTGAIAAALREVLWGELPVLEQEDVPDLNWVAISQAALPPVQAGRFIVHGLHDRNRIPRGPNAIMIDAGEAFGTAHHATTHGCLLAIDAVARKRSLRTVLDLGTGAGVLAIAVARAMPRARIIATDSDPVAVTVATGNAAANGVERRIAFARAEGLAHPWLRHAAPYDLIVANILAGPLIALASSIARASRRGSIAILSGLLNHEAATVAAVYHGQGFALDNHRRIAGWSTLTLLKRR